MGMRILVADDSDLVRKNVARMVSRECRDCDIQEAAGVRSSISAIDTTRFDVIVLDLSFPDGTGFAVLEHLRRAPPPAAPGPEVFVLTNHPETANRVRCEKLGAHGFFDKSYEFERLLDELKQRCTVFEATRRKGND